MKVQTLSVVVGTRACSAKCPFCVSRMTGFGELPMNRDLNTRNLAIACEMAKQGGARGVLITGKGEPTLYPEDIYDVLEELPPELPLVDLQTNALWVGKILKVEEKLRKGGLSQKDSRKLQSKLKVSRGDLKEWYKEGLSTIAISVVGIRSKWNREVYVGNGGEYPDLEKTVKFLRSLGFTVRLCVTMMKGYVDSQERVEEVIDWCRDNDVGQLTLRPVRKPDSSDDSAASDWTSRRELSNTELTNLLLPLRLKGTPLFGLSHGAEVYDYQGQNLCLSDCLTSGRVKSEDIRSLIFYMDGRLTTSWAHKGSVILQGRA